MTYKLGIDVGSTTLKAVVLNDQDEIVYKSYERHKSKVREMSVSKLKELRELLQGQRIALAITGSADSGITQMMQVFLSYRRYSQQPRLCVNIIRQVMSLLSLAERMPKSSFYRGTLEERELHLCRWYRSVYRSDGNPCWMSIWSDGSAVPAAYHAVSDCITLQCIRKSDAAADQSGL